MIGKLWPDSNCWCWGASCLSHAIWMRWSFTRPRASQKASAGFRSTPSQVFCLLLLFSKNHFHSRFGWPASPDLEQLPISRLAPQFLDKSCWHHQPSVISLISGDFFPDFTQQTWGISGDFFVLSPQHVAKMLDKIHSFSNHQGVHPASSKATGAVAIWSLPCG